MCKKQIIRLNKNIIQNEYRLLIKIILIFEWMRVDENDFKISVKMRTELMRIIILALHKGGFVLMKYSSYVDPFYGNFESDLPKPEGIAARWFFLKAQTGNTHPGAVIPFGMVSAAPYTGGYPTGCSPYWFNYYARPERIMDPEHLKIYGFSHFHQSGIGAVGQYYNYCIVTPSIIFDFLNISRSFLEFDFYQRDSLMDFLTF